MHLFPCKSMTLSFVLIFLTCGLYGVIHSILAALNIKNRAQEWNVLWYRRWYRLFYNIFATLTLLPVFWLMRRLPDQVFYLIPAPWIYLTLGIQLAGLVIMLTSIRQTGMGTFIGLSEVFSGGDAHPSQLTTTGLYRFVRHPIYTGGLLFLWFSPIMTSNYLAFAIAMTIYIFVGSHFEEKRLLVEFGDAYTKYREKTPLLFPKIQNFFSKS